MEKLTPLCRVDATIGAVKGKRAERLHAFAAVVSCERSVTVQLPAHCGNEQQLGRPAACDHALGNQKRLVASPSPFRLCPLRHCPLRVA